jgi:hypothetical protein
MRYFCHIVGGSELFPDELGRSLQTLESARRRAVFTGKGTSGLPIKLLRGQRGLAALVGIRGGVWRTRV